MDMNMELHNRCAVEWMILADYAEVVGGKLYLAGGGWDTISVGTGFPTNRMIGIAVAVSVPWNRTNEPHTFGIEIQDEDARSTLAKLDGRLEVGRPPGFPRGQPQRAQLALNLSIHFDGPGGFVVITRVDGEEDSQTPFRVVAA